VQELALNILQRYLNIAPTNVVSHSDISVGCKNDPDSTFPLEKLYKAVIGAWYDANTVQYL